MKSYPHIERYVRDWPWAILPGTLEAMIEAIALSKAGVELTEEELEARIKDGAGRGAPSKAGSVAVIPIYGVISPRSTLFSDVSGGTSLESFRSSLDEAVRDDDVGSILLDVNSPGGSTELLTETAAELRAAREVKPVVAVSNTLTASAAYHLASQADELFVTPSGYVGSVGVYSAHDDLSGAQEKAGVRTTLVHAGKYKVEANPFEPLSAAARAEIQRKVDAAYELMVDDIAAGRDVSSSSVREGFGQGRVLDAKAAAKAGMVDGIQTFDATLGALLSSSTPAIAIATASATGLEVTSLELPGLGGSGLAKSSSLRDDLEQGLAFLDGLVASSERLASVRGKKREHVRELASRLEAVLERTTPAAEEPAGENLEAETQAAMARARLSMT